MPKPYQIVRILGVDFYNDRLERALREAHEAGGLFLAPSGPGLAELGKNPHYDRALQEADLNLIDSGYLALLWQKRTGEALQRHSGLKFIKALIEDPEFKRNPEQLWVMPTVSHTKATTTYLQHEGLAVGSDHFYEAPNYLESPVTDEALLKKIRTTRPDYVILAIAGGKQEMLGHWLRAQLDYKPAIICIGAAIAFLTGKQASIPPWADRLYLGWLLRILQNPRAFFFRYWKARRLGALLKKHGADAPGKTHPRPAFIHHLSE
jgi:UDP-N-acetyl-D-mannosaminuronic acid transferase (WecB/TagA/CpsF family)